MSEIAEVNSRKSDNLATGPQMEEYSDVILAFVLPRVHPGERSCRELVADQRRAVLQHLVILNGSCNFSSFSISLIDKNLSI